MNNFTAETFETIISKFPAASYNNSRNIVRTYANKMRRSPSETAAHKLEQVGIPVDYKASDAGEPPKHAQQDE